MEKTSGLFSIHQVCKSCGLSRATVLRMEDRGLVKPAFIDQGTGYRYYDVNNITLILNVKTFLNMGLSYDDILLYYSSEGKSPALLHSLELRLEQMRRAYEEMRLRMEDKRQFTFEVIRLPEYVCYDREYQGDSLEGKEKDMVELFREAVERGYRPKIDQSIFIINKADFMGGTWNGKTHRYVCCVPVEPDCADEHCTVYPSCQALSLLCYGDYKAILQAQSSGDLGRCFREFGLKPAGFPRGISMVGPYTSVSIRPENFVSRIVVPIEPLSDRQFRTVNRKLAEQAENAK